jgi:hypothetical protein
MLLLLTGRDYFALSNAFGNGKYGHRQVIYASLVNT